MGRFINIAIMLRHLCCLLVCFHVALACFGPFFPPTPTPTPTPTPAPTPAPAPTPVSSCQCGRANRVAKIVGGVETEENEYPWQVGLLSRQSSSRPFCGGSLISSRSVLTAAHCTEGGSANYVLLGEHDLTKSDGEKKIRVCGTADHPNYNSRTTDYDFSVLTLCDDVPFQTDIMPACLPPNTNYNAENRAVVVSGWGTLSSGGSSPDVLREVTLQSMSNSQCSRRPNIYSSSQITSRMICASASGKDSCQGDSGGPMVTVDPGYYTLVGVVSWGSGCAQANAPGVYARVTSVLPWIQSNTQGSTCSTP